MTSLKSLHNRRVLVIDDNVAIHQDFLKVLGSNTDDSGADDFDALEAAILGTKPRSEQPVFEVHSAHQGEQGVQMAAAAAHSGTPFAMAFVDMRMPPGWDGLKTIEQLWKVDPNIQVVICSAHSDYEWTDVVERLNRSDKLLVLRKPFEPIEVQQCASALCQKWQNERLVRHQVDALEQDVAVRTQGLESANRQLRHLATHDTLTGLPNRVLLDDRLQQAIAQANRHRHTFVVMVCDFDRFKLINDSMGHRAGDEFLQNVTQRLTAIVREGDTFARLGGDEFVFVLSPPINAEEAEVVAMRAIGVLQTHVQIDGISIHTSASFGMATYPQDGETVDALLASADAAMYCAKQRGPNNLQHFAPTMGGGTQHRLKLESDLHEALARGQFELHYQPKVDTSTGAVRSAEALIRWRHPQRGLVPPAEFIPVAEDSGQIAEIGEWVLMQACRQARSWQDAGMPTMRIGVNISAAQFRQGALVNTVQRALLAAGLDAQYLELELTESAVMSNPEESVAILEELSCMGVLVSVDDFGTGYSSMSYLRRFPIDKLKIDKAFVSEMATRADDASIVQAIVSLAHSLRLKVVAEGVETTAQLDALKALGCDQYQGYHFSPALPPAEFEKLIRAQEVSESGEPHEDPDRTMSKLAILKPR
ncbi:MAG: EAL domain-containing protein [Pseudomonadota bacterium]